MIAKFLNRTLVLPTYWQHSHTYGKAAHAIPFSAFYQQESVGCFVPYTTALDNVVPLVVDGIAFAGSKHKHTKDIKDPQRLKFTKYVDKAAQALSLVVGNRTVVEHLSDEDLSRIGFDVHGLNFLRCTGLSLLKRPRVRKYKTLGILYYAPLPPKFLKSNTYCSQEYVRLSKCLQKPVPVMRTAQNISALLSRPYAVIHVRPFPDSCLELWEKAVGSQDRVLFTTRECTAPRDLAARMQRAVASLPRNFAAYVITIPSIEAVVFQLLTSHDSERNITSFPRLAASEPALAQLAVELDPDTIFQAELQVAIEADRFLGGHSSNSDFVNHERRIHGRRVSKKYTG